MLQTLRAPPKPGSLLESVLILLLMKLESIEHARFRALSQILISKKEGVEAFEEYMKIAFPYLEAAQSQHKKKAIEMLNQEIKRGPLKVTPQQTSMVKSKMKSKLLSRQKTQTREEADALYQKMGRAIPT